MCVLCTWMPVHVYVNCKGHHFVCAESTLLTRLLEAVSTIQLRSRQVSPRSVVCLNHPIVKSLYPSIQFNQSEGCRRQQMFENVLDCQRKYTLKDVVHDVWNEAFCCVEVCQLVQWRISVEAIGGGNVVVQWTTKAGAVILVGGSCP